MRRRARGNVSLVGICLSGGGGGGFAVVGVLGSMSWLGGVLGCCALELDVGMVVWLTGCWKVVFGMFGFGTVRFGEKKTSKFVRGRNLCSYAVGLGK